MSKLSEFWKKIGISVAILIACGIAGALLLIIVYCIPTDTIKKNITSGSEVLLIESAEFEYAPGYKSAILDNNTDALMLSIAAFPSDQPIRDAMLAPHYAYEKSRENVASLWGLLNDNTAEKKWRSDYGRYWHGYLVVLKPILTILDFSDLRIANQILQLILFVLVLLEVAKKHRDYLPAFIALMIFWNPATMGVSLQYAACYYVTMVGILLAEKFSMANDFQFGILFMIMGACTSYLDFLTFPIATLGIPLLFWLLNRYEAQKHTKPELFTA